MMKIRYYRAESGICRADLCGELVCQARVPDPGGGIAVRAFCKEHAKERDAELFVRNAGGETAEVLILAEYEWGADGRPRRRDHGTGIVD